jgi:heterotetrameric sarcosine oxidase gamma subunit
MTRKGRVSMADIVSTRLRPLAHSQAAGGAGAAVSMIELPPALRLSLRARGETATALGGAVGVTLPVEVCRAVSAGDRHALCLGPDEWLLIAPEGDIALLHAGEGIAASVVDISHRQTAIAVTGTKAAEALNAFCALDLDLEVFPVGMCTRTLLGKAEIILWRTDADAFRTEVWRSFAPYVWGCLEEARLEYGI